MDGMQTLVGDLTSLLECAVCKSVLVKPCVFPCGHVVCALCSEQLDSAAQNQRHRYQLAVDALQLRCPTCRDESILRHAERPILFLTQKILDRLSQEDPNFAERMTNRRHEVNAQTAARQDMDVIELGYLDFEPIIGRERIRLCTLVLQLILSRLLQGAREGNGVVVIQDRVVYQAFVAAGHMLSDMLFERCSLYSISVASQRNHEVIFYLYADAHTTATQRSFTNITLLEQNSGSNAETNNTDESASSSSSSSSMADHHE
jgi:hypothetical protein